MRLIGMHELLPTTDDSFKEQEIIVNFDNVLYFKPTLDGKYTSLGFSTGFVLVSEKYEDVVDTLNAVGG